jgi:hypothetical protein
MGLYNQFLKALILKAKKQGDGLWMNTSALSKPFNSLVRSGNVFSNTFVLDQVPKPAATPKSFL